MLLVSNLNFNNLQSLNRVIQNLGAAPATPTLGLEYFDTTKNSQMFWNGTAWIATNPALAPANSIPATSIANLLTTVEAVPLSSFAVPTADINMNGYTLTGLPAPTAAGQAAEYSWVMSQVNASAAGISLQPPVECVSVANQSTLSGLLTIDGITLTAGQRVLLVGQTTATENGVYIASSTAWSRATDTIAPETFWYTIAGTQYAGTQWKVSNTSAITIGTTAITISQFGAPINYTASSTGGLTLSGTVFSILLAASSGLQTTTNGLSVLLPASSGLQLAAGGLSVLTAAGSGILVGSTGVAIDTTVVARKYSATFGDGTSTTFTITHNLNTLDVVSQVRNVSSGAVVYADIVNATVNTITVSFTTAPAANSYRVSIMG